jgi:hypothetical protein
VTLILSDDKIDFYGSWSEIDSEFDRELNHVAFASRSDEASYERERIKERNQCVMDEKSRLSRLVGASTQFSPQYNVKKTEMYNGMPSTLSHASYRSRLQKLADGMFDRQLGAGNPETNGNASELSDSVVLAVRDLYDAHFDLIEIVELVGNTMVNQPRYDGTYDNLYQREFALWTNGEMLLNRATTGVTKAIGDQAEFGCYSQFPELD